MELRVWHVCRSNAADLTRLQKKKHSKCTNSYPFSTWIFIEFIYLASIAWKPFRSQPYARIEENDVATRRETIFYTKSMPEKITLKWKGEWNCLKYTFYRIYRSSHIGSTAILSEGTAVDPECGLDENAHVYSATINKKKVCYSVILGLVDIGRNKNSYFRMQLLQSNDQNL